MRNLAAAPAPLYKYYKPKFPIGQPGGRAYMEQRPKKLLEQACPECSEGTAEGRKPTKAPGRGARLA